MTFLLDDSKGFWICEIRSNGNFFSFFRSTLSNHLTFWMFRGRNFSSINPLLLGVVHRTLRKYYLFPGEWILPFDCTFYHQLQKDDSAEFGRLCQLSICLSFCASFSCKSITNFPRRQRNCVQALGEHSSRLILAENTQTSVPQLAWSLRKITHVCRLGRQPKTIVTLRVNFTPRFPPIVPGKIFQLFQQRQTQ